MPIKPPAKAVKAVDFTDKLEPKLKFDAQGHKMDIDMCNAIKGIAEDLWDQYPNKRDLVERIEHGLIFGEFAHNEHYSAKDIMLIIRMVEQEKAPPVEPIVGP